MTGAPADDVSRWSAALLGRAAFVSAVCLATGAIAGYALTHEPGPQRSSARSAPSATRDPGAPLPAGPTELALLAPLRVGSSLGDSCVIARIDAVTGGRIALRCAQGQARPAVIELDVTLASPDAPPPPATSGRYAIFYSADRAQSADAARLAAALARVLDAHAADPPPPGLTAFAARR